KRRGSAVRASLGRASYQRRGVLFLQRAGHQFLWRYLALIGFRQLDDEVDDLFLEDRRPQVVNRLRGTPIVIDYLTLVTRMAARFLGQRLVELLLAHGNVIAAADFGEQ